jgi:hypothetical protein
VCGFQEENHYLGGLREVAKAQEVRNVGYRSMKDEPRLEGQDPKSDFFI